MAHTERRQVLSMSCSFCNTAFQSADKDEGLHLPRLLGSCAHAFCTNCIQQLHAQSADSSVRCPLCSTVTHVRTQVQQECVVFTYLLQLVENAPARDLLSEDKHACVGDCQTENVAALYCGDCRAEFCVPCFDKAHRVNASRIPVKAAAKEQKSAGGAAAASDLHTFCVNHPQQPAADYGGRDGALLCESCKAEYKQKGLEVRAVGLTMHAEETTKQRMRHHVTNAVNWRKKYEAKVIELNSGMKRLDVSSEQAVERVNKVFDDLEREVKARREAVLHSLAAEYASHTNTLYNLRANTCLAVGAASTIELQMQALIKTQAPQFKMVLAFQQNTEALVKQFADNHTNKGVEMQELATNSKIDIYIPAEEMLKSVSQFVVVGTVPSISQLTSQAVGVGAIVNWSVAHHELAGLPQPEEYELQQAKIGVSSHTIEQTEEALSHQHFVSVYKGPTTELELKEMETGLHLFRVRARNAVGHWGPWSKVLQHNSSLTTIKVQCCGQPEKDAHSFIVPIDASLSQILSDFVSKDEPLLSSFHSEPKNNDSKKTFHHFQNKLSNNTTVSQLDNNNVVWAAYQDHNGQLDEWCSTHNVWFDRQTHRDFTCAWVKKWRCCRGEQTAPPCHLEQRM